MNVEERAHIEHLLQLTRAHLRELELKAAKYGDLDVPTHVTLQIAEYRQKIVDLQGQLSEALPRHNLPPRDYDLFVGRQKELAELRRLLQPYPKSRAYVITIDGIGGIGKSALALETAYAFQDSYASISEPERFDAIVWVSAKRSYLTADGILERRQAFRTLGDLYAAIAQVLDYPAITRAKAEDQRAIVEDVLREQRTLLILDNLETVDDEELLSFLHELPDPTKAVVTTRHRIDVARPVRLTGMPHEDALTLIEQETSRKDVTVSPQAQAQLWQRTGGVPLAIVWSIGLMGLGGSVESVLRRLGSGQSDIAKFCFEESVAQIRGRDANGLLLALALFDSSVSRQMLGEVAGLNEDEFGRDAGLADLLRLSLVNKEGDRFTLLPLTREFALTELTQLQTVEIEIRDRWVRTVMSIARPFADLVWRRPDRSQMGADGAHFITLAYWSQQVSRPDILLSIIPALVQYYDYLGRWSEALNVLRIGLEYSKLTGADSVAISLKTEMNWLLAQMGLHEEAERLAHEALDDAWKLRDVAWLCEALLHCSVTARRHGDLEKARQYCDQAMDLVPSLPEVQQKYERADIEYEMGKIARDLGTWQVARDYFTKARQVFRHDEQDSAFNAERAWGIFAQFGLIDHQKGNLDDAADVYQQSLDFFRSNGSKGFMTTLLVRLAILEEQRGNYKVAHRSGIEALDWSRRLGMVKERSEAEALLVRLSAADESSGAVQPS